MQDTVRPEVGATGAAVPEVAPSPPAQAHAGLPDIALFEAIYTARALRRLKPDPVPEELITRVLDAAIRAPSGGNAQNWAFIVVRDADKRRQLGAIYRRASDEVSAIYAARGRPAHMTLACRGLGLGTLITTNHLLYEDDVRSVLGIPPDTFTFALMPIGFPRGKYGPLARKPVSDVAYADGWGNRW
jgi:nitroreductase